MGDPSIIKRLQDSSSRKVWNLEDGMNWLLRRHIERERI
jgi:hypothetical protein